MRILSQREAFAFRFISMSDEDYEQHAAHVDRMLTDLKRQGLETRTMPGLGHVAANGRAHWTPERRRQHQELIRHFYDKMQASGVPQEGKAIVMGGLGGAGKGHAQSQPHIPLDMDRYFTLNPDDVKEEMARRGMIPQTDHLSPMEASGLAHEEASDLTKRIAMLAYRQKRNVNWDITMSSPGSVAKRINAMRKLGYNQIDGAFVDADPATARARVKQRHRKDEEPFRDAGQGIGGRWVPEEMTKDNLPTEGSGKLSKNAEVFDRLRPMFDNTLDIDSTGPVPQVRNQHGFRWKGGFPTWQPTGENTLMAKRIAWMLRGSPEGSVKDLLDQYRQGQIEYMQLVEQLASFDYSDPTIDQSATSWAETYDRGEQEPDDDSFFWVEAAVDDGTLSPDQVDEIIDAIDQYHTQQGDPDFVVDDDYDEDYDEGDDDEGDW